MKIVILAILLIALAGCNTSNNPDTGTVDASLYAAHSVIPYGDNVPLIVSIENTYSRTKIVCYATIKWEYGTESGESIMTAEAIPGETVTITFSPGVENAYEYSGGSPATTELTYTVSIKYANIDDVREYTLTRTFQGLAVPILAN